VARGRAAGGTSPGTTRGPGKGAAEDRGRRGWGRARPGRVTHGQGEGTRGREEEGEERGRGGGSSPRGSTIAKPSTGSHIGQRRWKRGEMKLLSWKRK
jgi:hypothetical protein